MCNANRLFLSLLAAVAISLWPGIASSEPASFDYEQFIASQPPPAPPPGLAEEQEQQRQAPPVGSKSHLSEPAMSPPQGPSPQPPEEVAPLNEGADNGGGIPALACGCEQGDCTVASCDVGTGGCGCSSCSCTDCQCEGDDCCCNGCGCDSCCEPQWYLQAGAIWLWRNNRTENRPLVLSEPGDFVLVDTHTREFDGGAGPRIVLGVDLNDCDTWEFEYYSALGLDASVLGFGDDNLRAPGELGEDGEDWSSADAIETDYTSELHNVEINYFYNWSQWSLLAGMRFVRFTERLELQAYDFPFGDESRYRTHTRNDLYGFQIGARYRDCAGRFFWEFTGKAGIYGNDARQNQFITDDDGSDLLRDTGAHRPVTAFIGSLDFSLGYELNDVWSLRGGWHWLWLESVALAGNQIDFDLNSFAGSQLHTRSGVFFSGIDLGLEACW